MEKIAVIRLDRIGDLILTTPAIASLKATFPESHITAIVNDYNKAVLEHSPHIDEIWAWKWDLKHIADLRKRAFDMAVVFSPTTASYWIAFFSGAKVRAGYVYKSRVLSFLLSRIWLNRVVVCSVDQVDLEKRIMAIPHEIEQNLEVVQAVSHEKASLKTQLEVPVPESEAGWGRSVLPPEPRIGIHLTESWFDGLPENFLERLMQALLKKGNLFVTLGPREDKIFDQLNIFKEVQYFKNLSLSQWASLFRNAQVILTPNTGALHLAASQGTPVVALFEPKFFAYHSRRWYPWQVPHQIVRKDDPLLFQKLVDGIGVYISGERALRSNLQS